MPQPLLSGHQEQEYVEPGSDLGDELEMLRSQLAESNKWDAIKVRLAPRLREAVDVLLLQGSMKRTQLAAALKMDYSNCTKNVVQVLKSQGWLVENNGNLSLRVL